MAPHLLSTSPLLLSFFFFFNDPATTEIYTLSLHDALPISALNCSRWRAAPAPRRTPPPTPPAAPGASCWGARDRKSTRLNSSHVEISYAVFCLKKKKKKNKQQSYKKYHTHKKDAVSTR